MRTILWLNEITTEDRACVGGKTHNLARAAQAGFPVPPAFCVTAEVYREFVTANGLEPVIRAALTLPESQARRAALHLQEAIRTGHLEPELQQAIRAAYHKLATDGRSVNWPVAVRSSASAEDLPTASFAGQQATLLNIVDEEQLLPAILECWASLWSPQAVAYRGQRQAEQQEAPLIAVLVQRMVQAEAAGVAFSVHPLLGQNAVLIEAAFGLGESVVGGETEVDRYVVNRETGVESEPPAIAHKQSQHVLACGGGLQLAEVPAEQRDARVLSPLQVQQLAATVLALEQRLGGPQDVEWAWAQGQFYVLQSRPITTQAESFFTQTVLDGESTWTSGFLNERFPLPVSPLGWSVVQELLEELAFRDPLRYLGTPYLEQVRITRLYRGHPYVNMFVFQTLYKAFPDSLLPEDAGRYFPEGKAELRRQVPYPSSLFDPRFLSSMFRHLTREPQVWSPWHNYRTWSRFVLDHDRRSQQLEAEWQALQQGSPETGRIWAAIAAAQQLNRELLSLHRWSLTIADLAYTLLRRLLRAWAGDEEWLSLCTRLVTGLPNKSLQIDRALHRLAEIQDPTAFAQALQSFLADYGHRSFHLDIYHPPFAEEPAQVMELVERLRGLVGEEASHDGLEQGGIEPPLPSAETTEVVTTVDGPREEARARLRELCRSGPVGCVQQALLEHLLRLVQHYLPLREDQRFYWQRTLAQMRRFFLLLGQGLVADSVLEQEQDIFFLTKQEIEAYAIKQSRGAAYAALARSRKQQFANLCREFSIAPDWAYPPFLRGNQPLQVQTPDGVQLCGRAVSPGLARGPVLVLFSPAELYRVQAGDVLVTRSVDPGWTPIFGLLSALVVEYGGQLSHAAVVAREYGLPMVAGVTGATRLLHNGDQVVVDGLNGVVAKR